MGIKTEYNGRGAGKTTKHEERLVLAYSKMAIDIDTLKNTIPQLMQIPNDAVDAMRYATYINKEQNQHITFNLFKKAIKEIVNEDVKVIATTAKDEAIGRIEQLVSIKGDMYSIGNQNDVSQWSICKINFYDYDSRIEVYTHISYDDLLMRLNQYKHFNKNI